MRLAVLEQSDGRVAFNIDSVTSIQEVREEDDNDYVAVIFKGSTLYFSNYTHGKIVSSLERDKRIYVNTTQGKDENRRLFFTFEYKGKKLSFRLDDIVYIQETDIEGEYYLTIRLRDGVEYDIEDVKFNDIISDLTWTVIIGSDKE